MLVGVHEDRDPAQTKEDYPRVKLVRRFIPGVLKPQTLIKKMFNLGQPVWAINAILVLSFKPDLKTVANGQWDAYLGELAAWIKANTDKPVWLVFHHEPENDMTASQFVAMFNRCHSVVKEVHPQIVTIHSAMAYQYRSKGKAGHAGAWLTHADINTCDVYSGNTTPLNATLPEHEGFKRWYEVFGQTTWGITERGFIANPNSAEETKTRADAIRREAAWVSKTSCMMYIYWNTSGTENNPELVLDPKGEEAVLYLTELLAGGTPVPPKPETRVVTCPTCKGKGEITIVND